MPVAAAVPTCFDGAAERGMDQQWSDFRPMSRLHYRTGLSAPGMPGETAKHSAYRETETVSMDNLLTDLYTRGFLSRELPPADAAVASNASPVAVDFGAAIMQTLAAFIPNVEVGLIARVQCPVAAAAYAGVRQALGPERLLWHGTAWECVPNIARNGFNRAYAYNRARHGARLGRGTYFAEDPSFALRFCGRRSKNRALLLAGVLPGRWTRGEDGLIEPPQDTVTGARFDSTVENVADPHVFCVFRDFQALPLFLVELL